MAFTALAAGVSGLQAFTEGVGVIADNITNVNTIGYKETRSRFSTLVTETAALSSYSPGGVRAYSDTLVSKQGLLQPSSSATDLSIDGAGFFVVRNGSSAEDASGELLYTRAGAFSKDNEGYFRNTAGLYLMGWPLASDGSLPTNLNDPTELQPITINNLNGLGEATSNVSLVGTLNSEEVIDGTPYAWSFATPAAAGISEGSITADFVTNFQIYDSQGGEHTVVLSATKTDTDTWSYELAFDDPTELDGATHPNGIIAYGEMVFGSKGELDMANSSMFDSSDTNIGLEGALAFSYDSTGDYNPDGGSITFDFGTDGGKDGFSQSSSTSTLYSASADGASFDEITGVSIGEDGAVTAIFKNGLTYEVFKVPVATFQNPDGLSRRQGNAYGISDLAGDAIYHPAGEGGAGSISPNSLEQSTVDLASEFAELIKVQRAFSASTRIITTADQILEELTRI